MTDTEEVVLSLDWASSLTTGGDVLHGGIVMAHSRPLHIADRQNHSVASGPVISPRAGVRAAR
jgi:hypothetical protein